MAVVKTNYDRRGKVGNAKAKDNLRYIQHRPDKDNEAVWRPLFSGEGPMTRQEAYQFIDDAPKGTKFFTFIISPDPEKEDTHKDLDMRQITITTMQTVEEIMQGQGITTPVVWVAAVHDDHTDKNHVHALAAIQGRLDKPDVQLSLSRFLSGMMRLSPYNTVTGGMTHGRCTVHRAAVPSDGVPGFHERDA
jgi:hypothetical protein